VQLAYLIANVVADESWTGGLLITDHRGLPLDFRYVEPIRPNKIQKLIYGGALKRYLLLDAIAGTLLKAVNPKVDFIFTDDTLLLELEGKIGGRFIVVENGSIDPLEAIGKYIMDGAGKIDMQVTPSGPPAKLIFPSSDDGDTEKVAEKLASLTRDLNFTEPLSRVGEALKEICQNGRD
jgi:hypothetical protein